MITSNAYLERQEDRGMRWFRSAGWC